MGEHNTNHTAAEQFIARWTGKTASELSSAQSFVIELCALLGVAPPTHELDYMFERPITFSHGDGSTSAGRIDCYLRGHFVLEAKKVKAGPATKGFDDALLRARLVALNAQRAAEEEKGTVRWLRPEFHDPAQRAAAQGQAGSDGSTLQNSELSAHIPPGLQPGLAMDMPLPASGPATGATPAKASRKGKSAAPTDAAPAAPASSTDAQAWPAALPEQVREVAAVLAASPAAVPLAAIEARFKGRGPWKKSLPRILETLEALGRARREGHGWRN